MLAIGSFLFGLLLIIFRFNKNNPQKVPFWITAKILQAAGSLMLYYRPGTFDGLTMLANIALLLGCAYEAWAIRILSGQAVKRWLHILTSVGIILVSSITICLFEPYRKGLFLLLQSAFYFLPGIFLFRETEMKFSLQSLLAVCYCVTGSVFLLNAIVCLAFPAYALSQDSNAIFNVIPVVSFCIFLISGFILLMLAKERSDVQVLEIQKNLKKSEIRYQRIVETANEGILIFDEHYKITFANKKMASILGYTVDEMLERPYASFFPKNQLSKKPLPVKIL